MFIIHRKKKESFLIKNRNNHHLQNPTNNRAFECRRMEND